MQIPVRELRGMIPLLLSGGLFLAEIISSQANANQCSAADPGETF